MRVAAPLPVDIRLMNTVTGFMLALGVFACLGAGAWWVLRHPAFALQLISVEGEVSRNNALTLKTNVIPRLQGNFFTLELAQARQVFGAVKALVEHAGGTLAQIVGQSFLAHVSRLGVPALGLSFAPPPTVHPALLRTRGLGRRRRVEPAREGRSA